MVIFHGATTLREPYETVTGSESGVASGIASAPHDRALGNLPLSFLAGVRVGEKTGSFERGKKSDDPMEKPNHWNRIFS